MFQIVSTRHGVTCCSSKIYCAARQRFCQKISHKSRQKSLKWIMLLLRQRRSCLVYASFSFYPLLCRSKISPGKTACKNHILALQRKLFITSWETFRNRTTRTCRPQAIHKIWSNGVICFPIIGEGVRNTVCFTSLLPSACFLVRIVVIDKNIRNNPGIATKYHFQTLNSPDRLGEQPHAWLSLTKLPLTILLCGNARDSVFTEHVRGHQHSASSQSNTIIIYSTCHSHNIYTVSALHSEW